MSNDRVEAPEPRTDEAIEFLRAWHAEGPWHLVAIPPDGTPTARTFAISEANRACAWINKYQGTANLYFHVNDLREGFEHKKAKKSDVEKAIGLHVDVDDLDALPSLQQFEPRPTVIIYSGGGYQAFWLLEKPSTDIAVIEAHNLRLAELLGGDNCHNIDRIMRLSGTINVPNRKKREKGRTKALAYVVEADWTRSYSLDEFNAGESRNGKTVSAKKALASGTLADLPATISKCTRSLILLGDDPARPRGTPKARYPSRSEVLLRVVCDMVRAGCPDELILAVVLNPDHGISSSVLDKADPRAYALRQVSSAREKIAAGWPDTSQGGRPRPTYLNALLAVSRLNISTRYDMFHNRMYLGGRVLQSYQGELTDNGVAIARTIILREFHFDPGKDHLRDALQELCLEHQFHPIREYLDGLKWDGVERLPTWLTTYAGAEDTPLNRQFGHITLIAAVRRIRQPGVKFDTILVLEGPQGSGKSSLLSILAGPENFSDQDILTLDSKSQMETLEGVWIHEISELEGLSRADIARVKAFVSRAEDRARPAYGRFRENRPRHSIFIGTTNDDQYLRDQTGNRRFWPVRTGEIDLDSLRRDRDQIWAEAAHKEAKGLSIVLPEEYWSDARHEQDLRMEDDTWLDILRNEKGKLYAGEFRVSSAHILTEVLKIAQERQLPHMSRRVGALMRKLQWSGPKLLRFADGTTSRGYSRPPNQGDFDLDQKK